MKGEEGKAAQGTQGKGEERANQAQTEKMKVEEGKAAQGAQGQPEKMNGERAGQYAAISISRAASAAAAPGHAEREQQRDEPWK